MVYYAIDFQHSIKMARTRFSFNFVKVDILYDKPLGSGAYGAVYKAKCDKLPCAAKILHSSFLNMADTMERFKQECDFLESIKHPNIVQFLGVYNDPTSNQTALVMELMEESLSGFLDRHNAIGDVPYHTQVGIGHDVVLALHYLHTNEIIHRDLSSNNVLLLGGGCIAKVTDLGVSRIKDAIQQQQMTQCPGSPVYMPPEALRSIPMYSDKLDSFSFGVLLIQIQTRRFPDPDSHELLIADASSPTGFVSMPVKETDRRDKDISRVPDNQLKAVALRCIEDMPDNRPTSEHLCDLMEEIKSTQEYLDSKSNASAPAQVKKPDSSVASSKKNDSGVDLMTMVKDKEIESLRDEVKHFKKLLEEKTALQLKSTPSASAVIGGATPCENVNLEQSPGKPTPKPNWDAVLDSGTKVVSQLNPNTVNLLSKSTIGEISGVLYNRPGPGCITVAGNSRSELNTTLQKLMLAYQKLSNSPTQLTFVGIPDNCPEKELERLLQEYNVYFKQCSFTFIRDVGAIQVVSTNQTELNKAVDHLRNATKYTMYFSGGRKLMLRKGDITKQDVNVIVCPSNASLNPNGGVAKAVNQASKGRVEQHCKEHIRKYGPLNECGTATTPAGGNLKCKYVIHVLAPQGQKRSAADCQRMMMKLVKTCLDNGNKLSARSIALPSIGTGHMGVKTNIAANGIITAIMDYDFQEEDSLQEISIVIIDDQTYSEFRDVFSDRLADCYAQEDLFGMFGMYEQQPFSSIKDRGSGGGTYCQQQ